ncbi:ABC-type uncharacterized transport system permease subunit [Aequitasia blattaphilus]|uniref:ABC transporter permease n=1 Tax=Aequitasia blattaphilus TaxID=2949332 RepID=A0ABT1E7Y3_9FIRM|nr:ABC transporter permease [Aequitasia blattaphilus]MCP1101933.1 ABC transporter permease [Aequitasia blattaphilus]MCR8614573.1 ABC transporter permease [Aequitasia blattaphilus]
MSAIIENVDKIFNVSLIYATFRSATPIIFAALCAALTQQANILNIGTEGIMLVGSFTAVGVSYLTGNWVIGVLAAMISGAFIASIMAVGHIKYNAEICAIGMGINMLALAVTKLLLNVIFKTNGTFSDPKIVPIPKVHFAFMDDIPVLNQLLNNWSITEWLAIVLILVLQFLFYKTVWGLRLRAVGQFAMAAQTAGIKVTQIKYQAMIASGLMGGLAGAHLSLGYSTQFVENMTNNRGFMGVAAMYFGGANPILTALGCLLFGFADSVGARLQAYGIPSQFVLMMPYIVTIVILAISMYVKYRNNKRKESSLLAPKAQLKTQG